MSKIVLIVDYNNIFIADNCTAKEIELTLKDVVEQALQVSDTVNEILIRIYEGWYQDEKLTDRGSSIMSKFAQIEPFPNVYKGKSIVGKIDFVEQIYGIDFPWRNTYREKPGPRLIIKKDVHRPHCPNNKDKCPVELLAKFTKKKEKVCHVDGCNVNNMSVFSQYGQKMVDTMMACDILTYGEEEDTAAIYVLTDDVDLFPSIALCSRKNPNVKLYIGTKNNKHVQECDVLNNNFGITTFLLV